MANHAKKYYMAAAFLAAMGTSNIANAEDTSNLDLAYEAQGRFQELMRNAATPYSERLKALENALNDYAKRNGLDQYSKITFLDPVKADIGVALGLDKRMIGQTLLMEQGVMPYQDFSYMLGNAMVAASPSITDDNAYTQNPQALFVRFNDARKSPCVIVPSPANNVPDTLTVPGMSLQQAQDYRNRHEGWHCLDSVYFPKPIPSEVYLAARTDSFSSFQGRQDLLEGFINLQKTEILADVATLGEMVRAGHDVELIDTVVNWRASAAEHLAHLTAPALEQLKSYIEKVGLEEFNGMSEKEAVDTYYAITEDHALSVNALDLLLTNETGEPVLANASYTELDIQKAAAYQKYRDAAAPSADISMVAAMTSIMGGAGKDIETIQREKSLEEKLKGWSALDDLTHTAYTLSGKVTPETMIGAYITLQTEYDNASERNPQDADMYAEMATRLKSTFVQKTLWSDFTAINLKHDAVSSPKKQAQYTHP